MSNHIKAKLKRSTRAALALGSFALLLAFGAGSASANRGTLTASCNGGVVYNQQRRVDVNVFDLLPAGGQSQGRISATVYIQNYSTGQRFYATKSFTAYSDPNLVTVGGSVTMFLPPGWWRVQVTAYGLVGNQWQLITNRYVPYQQGGWWCPGSGT